MNCKINVNRIVFYILFLWVSLTNVSIALEDSIITCDIKGAQIALKQQDIDAGPIDGIWGKSTLSAVKSFQRSNGITETGRLDASTCEALGVKTIKVINKSCKDILKEWTTYDMDRIAAAWKTDRETAEALGIKPPAVIPPKGCKFLVRGSKVTPYCNGKALTNDSCDHP